MPKVRTYVCPSCTQTFRFMHHPVDEPPPRFCPHCAFDTEAGDDALTEDLTMPFISNARAKSVDGYHRAMEEGAEFRALKAEADHGLTRAEANEIRLTDMKDNLREGDTSNVPIVNPVSQKMDAEPGRWGFKGAEQGIGFSAGVTQGAFPNAGMRTHTAARSMLQNSGVPITDRPALETMQPGYKRRT